jgi:hypothetical protein
MSALAREGGIEIDTWCGEYEGSWFGFFEDRPVEAPALRMLYSTGDFALMAAYATLGIDEYCIHTNYLLQEAFGSLY